MKYLLVLLFLVFVGCGGGSSGDGAPKQTEPTSIKNNNDDDSSNTTTKIVVDSDVEYLYGLMKENYLWNEYVPTASEKQLSNYENADDYLEDVRYEQDRWSYIEDLNDYEDRSNQIDSGFGCFYYFDDNDNVFIFETEIASPCDTDGLQRGDRVISINGIPIDDISNEYYNNLRADVGVSALFEVIREGVTQSFSVTPEVYNYETVKSQVLTQDSVKIGHMIYDSFTSASFDEFDTAFTTLKSENVTEFILDLRYNGGGSLGVASVFLDMLSGNIVENSKQFYLLHNDNNSHDNEYGYFLREDNSLSLDRIFILTTEDTASASELVINALKPYIDVIQIGSTTHGKPVGMSGFKKDKKVFWPITFRIVNADYMGEYYDGIVPDCVVADDLNYLRTDENDPMIQAALNYIDHDSCN